MTLEESYEILENYYQNIYTVCTMITGLITI